MTASVALFLSCLYGSEHPEQPAVLIEYFLSCLYGSEPAAHIPPPHVRFLAAYTAVNMVNTDALAMMNFLAAYTAVNSSRFIFLEQHDFLAAYTAVN